MHARVCVSQVYTRVGRNWMGEHTAVIFFSAFRFIRQINVIVHRI